MSKLVFAGLVFLTGTFLGAQIPEESIGGSVPNMIFMGNRLEGIVEQRVITIDPVKGTWIETIPGLSLITENLPIKGNVAGFWDGVDVYREITGFNQKRILQHGFQEKTSTGRSSWFWRAPVELPEFDRVLAVFSDKAITRRDRYAAGSKLKPGEMPSSQGASMVSIALVDLIHGDRKELFTREIEPYVFQCGVAMHMGSAYLFMNTGQAFKLAPDAQSLQSLAEDFWKDCNIAICDGEPFSSYPLIPRFRSHPFFDHNGGILLAFNGWRPEPIDGSELIKMDEKFGKLQKQRLQAKGVYPFHTGQIYNAPVRSAILLKFNPDLKKVTEEPLERVKDFCREGSNEGLKSKYLEFSQSDGELYVGPTEKIKPLQLTDLQRADAVPVTQEKVEGPAKPSETNKKSALKSAPVAEKE